MGKIHNIIIYRHNWIQFIGSIFRIQNAFGGTWSDIWIQWSKSMVYNEKQVTWLSYGFRMVSQEQMEIQFMGNHSQNDGWIRLNNLKYCYIRYIWFICILYDIVNMVYNMVSYGLLYLFAVLMSSTGKIEIWHMIQLYTFW